MLNAMRSIFWALAILGNLIAAYLLWYGASNGILSLAGSVGAAALLMAVIPTCLALAIDKGSR